MRLFSQELRSNPILYVILDMPEGDAKHPKLPRLSFDEVCEIL
jgi:hypothetical protein